MKTLIIDLLQSKNERKELALKVMQRRRNLHDETDHRAHTKLQGFLHYFAPVALQNMKKSSSMYFLNLCISIFVNSKAYANWYNYSENHTAVVGQWRANRVTNELNLYA